MAATPNPSPDPTAASPPRPRRWIPLALRMFVLLLLLAAVGSIPRNSSADDDDELLEETPPGSQIDDETFNKIVFGIDESVAAARLQLDELLSDRIESIDEFCGLTESEQQKLLLAGRGDIQRFVDRVERLRRQLHSSPDVIRLRLCVQQAQSLNQFYSSKVLARGSLFAKTVNKILTPAQTARYARSALDWRNTRCLPDRIAWGTVRVGAMVEANLRLDFQGDVADYLRIRTEMPPYVHIRQTRMGRKKTGDSPVTAYCDLRVALDTEHAGEFQGTIQLLAENELIEVPVAASVLESEPGLSRVLMIEPPFKEAATDNASDFEPWLELVKSAKLDIHYLDVDRVRPILRDVNLSRFDVILVGSAAIYHARAADFDKLTKFVESGGRVIVATSRAAWGTVTLANEFVARFGLRMSEAEGNAPYGRAIKIDDANIADHRLTTGIHRLCFHEPALITVENERTGEILAATPSTTRRAGYVAVARAGPGDVVVLGVSPYWNWIAGDRDASPDNALLLHNLLSKR